eukprot:2591995-Rhodomonas_salina.2
MRCYGVRYYARAVRCPVLTRHMILSMPGTEKDCASGIRYALAIVLRVCYVMSCSAITIVLRVCYAIPGTEIACACTYTGVRSGLCIGAGTSIPPFTIVLRSLLTYSPRTQYRPIVLRAFLATRTTTQAIVLRIRYAMSGTELCLGLSYAVSAIRLRLCCYQTHYLPSAVLYRVQCSCMLVRADICIGLCYAMSGTEVVHGGTTGRWVSSLSVGPLALLREVRTDIANVPYLATPCAVLTWHVVPGCLRCCYGETSRVLGLAYASTRLVLTACVCRYQAPLEGLAGKLLSGLQKPGVLLRGCGPTP